MKKIKEMLQTNEIRQILIKDFYGNRVDFADLYTGQKGKELTIDDRLSNMFNSLSDIIDSHIKAINQLSGEEFFELLSEKQTLLNSFNRNYYKNTLANNYSFAELPNQIIDDVIN